MTSSEKVIGRWKEHFEEFLNLTNPPSMVEAELEEVTEVVKQLHSGKALVWGSAKGVADWGGGSLSCF